MKIKSHAMLINDFSTPWYAYWKKELKQDSRHLLNMELKSNKFWQNASICQALYERGVLKAGSKGIGFGVGQERLPAVFAKFGVNVTATDQDFRKRKAKQWSKAELARGIKSLNLLNIVDDDVLKKLVQYHPLDMNNIPSEYSGQFDFIWSNCSLGHLGTIERGLNFIEASLSCLTPGGWAVHTTEVNITSDANTLESGDTVIFRLSDINALYLRLTGAGYRCSPLLFSLGDSVADNQVSLRPLFGNSYSKIQVGGHLATQVILLIQKPKKTKLNSYFEMTRLRVAYRKNLKQIERFNATNKTVIQAKMSQNVPSEKLTIAPLKRKMTITIPSGKTKEFHVEYLNKSNANLYSIFGYLIDNKPIALGTDQPRDRMSIFDHSSWVGDGKNLPSSDLVIRTNSGKYSLCESVAPGMTFAFKVFLDATRVKPGLYTESFSVVQETVGWIDNSEIELTVKVL